MLAWSEQHATGAAPEGATTEIQAWAYVGDTIRVEVLERRGYQKDGLTLVYRFREFSRSIEQQILPDGYTFDHLRGEIDLERRVEAHRNAFAPSRMSVEKHQRVMTAPTYRPELDIIVIAPDRSVAAFCIVWYDETNRNGVFEPVGCRTAHQRKGLTKAVMLEGCRRLAALGAASACVVCDANSPAANRLYESAGFREIDRNHRWVKHLHG